MLLLHVAFMLKSNVLPFCCLAEICIDVPLTLLRYRAVYLQIPLLLFVFVLVCLVGLTVFAYYELEGCDPLRSGLIDNSNQVPGF